MGIKFNLHRIVAAVAAVLARFQRRCLLRKSRPEIPARWEALKTTGEATVGYRFIDVSGYRSCSFNEMFNLRDGSRLHDMTLYGDAQDRKVSFADRYSFTASGIGGDPFPSAQFMVSEDRTLRIPAAELATELLLIWNQNDGTWLFPSVRSLLHFRRGLTTNHDWATVRKFEDRRNSRFMRREICNSPLKPGTRAMTEMSSRPGPSILFQLSRILGRIRAVQIRTICWRPCRTLTNRVAGGIDYSWRSWSFPFLQSGLPDLQ